MPAKSILEPWNLFFTEIHNSLHEELALHCLGGFVMTMLYGLDRPTADVDVLPLGVNSATASPDLHGFYLAGTELDMPLPCG